MSYITPKVQLTWSRVGSKDYTGSANNGATMEIYQDSYDSLIRCPGKKGKRTKKLLRNIDGYDPLFRGSFSSV